MENVKDKNESIEIKHVNGEDDAKRCWPVFKELRSNIDSKEEFIKRFLSQLEQKYKIIYIDYDNQVVAAAGFRFMNTMAWGKIIYIDDLIALQDYRGKGFGTILLNWIQDYATKHNFDAIHLDTGYQRHMAHKSYLRNGFTLNCHHMEWLVKQ